MVWQVVLAGYGRALWCRVHQVMASGFNWSGNKVPPSYISAVLYLKEVKAQIVFLQWQTNNFLMNCRA